MTQYCRYCCYLCVGDANYCSEKQQTMSDTVAKSNGFGGVGMERLTERTEDGILVKEDYEKESGIVILKTLYSCYGEKPNPHYTNCEEGYCAMEKLADYEDAEEQGRLIKLPCKVGDKIFLDFAGFGKDIDKFTVKDFHLDCFEDGETILFCDYESNDKTLSGQIDVTEFGKTVFLTKAEAEAKLKELRGGENE